MSFEIILHQNRTCDFDVTILDAAGNAVTVAAGDVIRLKIGQSGGSLPVLELDSAAPTVNGSSISASNPTTIRIAQGDTAGIRQGTYDAEIGIVDDSETQPPDAFKHADSGVVHVLETLAGEVGTS